MANAPIACNSGLEFPSVSARAEQRDKFDIAIYDIYVFLAAGKLVGFSTISGTDWANLPDFWTTKEVSVAPSHQSIWSKT